MSSSKALEHEGKQVSPTVEIEITDSRLQVITGGLRVGTYAELVP